MQLFRRSRFLLISFEKIRPSGKGSAEESLVLTSILSGDHLLTSTAELDRLCLVESDQWVTAQQLEDLGFRSERIDQMALLGVLITDKVEGPFEIIRQREETLSSGYWPPAAAIFHLLNHHHESRVVPIGKVVRTASRENEAQARAAAFTLAHGAPPPPFFSHGDNTDSIELPLELDETPFREILLRRRTCRYFESSKPLPFKMVAQLLRLAFGAWSQRKLTGVGELLLKTSPSGGSLHPIEAYPVVLNCQGLQSGIYHYRVKDHALEKVLEQPEERLRNLAVAMTQGQEFVGSCAMLVILVARFARNFWKYRERENSYAVVLQDAGHLSQTFQLTATDLRLGAFYTAAINSEAICRVLQLDYPALSPVGILGVGYASGQTEQTTAIEPFEPEHQGR